MKKADQKNMFTLRVLVDDKTVEKKDRTLGEPLQFYTGPDHVLYELVVFTGQQEQHHRLSVDAEGRGSAGDAIELLSDFSVYCLLVGMTTLCIETLARSGTMASLTSNGGLCRATRPISV